MEGEAGVVGVLLVGALGLLAIAFSASLAPRLRIASPLLLVVLGIAVGALPQIPDITIDPEWILAGVLPPLLYSAAVQMPTMDFRRDLRTISGLSVALVVVSAVALGFLFHARGVGRRAGWIGTAPAAGGIGRDQDHATG